MNTDKRQLALDTDVFTAGGALFFFLFGMISAGRDLWHLLTGRIQVLQYSSFDFRVSFDLVSRVLTGAIEVWIIWIAWKIWSELDQIQRAIAGLLVVIFVLTFVLQRFRLSYGVRWELSALLHCVGFVCGTMVMIAVVRWLRSKVRYV